MDGSAFNHLPPVEGCLLLAVAVTGFVSACFLGMVIWMIWFFCR